MKTRLTVLALILVLSAVMVSGCAKPYAITTSLDASLEQPAGFRVGTINDALPPDLDLEDRPSAEDIDKFEQFLIEEIENRKLNLELDNGEYCGYEINASLLDYKKGSGFLRFLIGFGAGGSKVVTEVKLVDLGTGETVFGGNFDGKISSWMEKGSSMFKSVARNFSKALEKQQNKLVEE